VTVTATEEMLAQFEHLGLVYPQRVTVLVN
jgi:hypothetical protein